MDNIAPIGMLPRHADGLAAIYDPGAGLIIASERFQYAIERLRLEDGELVVVDRERSSDYHAGELSVRSLVDATGTPRLPDHFYNGGEFPILGGAPDDGAAA